MSKLPEQTTLHETYPPNGVNGSPSQHPSAPPIGSNGFTTARTVPTSVARKSRRPFWIAGLLVLIAGIAGATYYFNRPTGDRADVILYKVKKEMLLVSVTEKGTLESADNRDLICKVRAGNKGNQGFATSINWVIDDGTRVKPGQLLMQLDDSALRDQEETQSITVKEKLALKVQAEKDYEIQIKKNESSIALAQTALTVAEIELDKLTGLEMEQALIGLAAVAGIPSTLTENGAFRQELDDLTGQISLAKSTVEQNGERAAWADRMVKLSYMSAAQAQAEKSRLDSSKESLRSLESKKAILISHDRLQRITTLTSTRDNARRALDQAKLEAEANEVKTRTTKETATSIYLQAFENLEDIKRQRKECKIVAPDDIIDGSMVVYFKNESNRFSSNNTGLIEQGAQVKEGQKMLRIPNLDRMQVSAKVHEAMVARIHGDVRVPTHLVEFVQAGMVASFDPISRIIAARSDTAEVLRTGPHGLRRFEYKKIADGQRTTIRVESIPEKQFVGHVRTVSAVASQADWWNSDAKLYQTYITIDGELLPDGRVVPIEGEHIKPDMTAEVTISVDAVKKPVVTAPIQAIIGGAEMGATREVFVKTAAGYERREVKLGLYNDKMVEIREGLAEGDEIAVNPKVLLGDKDKTKTRDAGDSKETKDQDSDKTHTKPGGDAGPGSGPTKGGFPGGGDPTKGKGGSKKGKKGGFPGGGGGGGPPVGT